MTRYGSFFCLRGVGSSVNRPYFHSSVLWVFTGANAEATNELTHDEL